MVYAFDHCKASRFRPVDEGLEQHAADPLPASLTSDVDAVLGHAGIHASLGHTAYGRPADDVLATAGNQAVVGKVGGIPGQPVGCSGLERGVAGGDALFVNRPLSSP